MVSCICFLLLILLLFLILHCSIQFFKILLLKANSFHTIYSNQSLLSQLFLDLLLPPTLLLLSIYGNKQSNYEVCEFKDRLTWMWALRFCTIFVQWHICWINEHTCNWVSNIFGKVIQFLKIHDVNPKCYKMRWDRFSLQSMLTFNLMGYLLSKNNKCLN